ncbi:MAG: glycosyl transferase family 2 [Puniceicoccaceae bacterium]|nr:glycosyl transferase family 2 [Puniceicoccaceae bacterium]|tara:strand:+ start:19280 stop:20113 length:834 start_codon:yes stop_codon:yes gene_type:complete
MLPDISIFILTLNEEQNVDICLESVRDFDDVVVLDSFSSDKTVELAEAKGARVVQRKFDNWAAHQNWAMANIEFKHKWVFYLDADERMTPELQAEITAIAANEQEQRRGFSVGRTNYFMGRTITHCYPAVPIMRFFQPKYIRYERLVNPIALIDGETGHLSHRFLHYNFSKGLTEWFDKHNKYALSEAKEGLKALREQDPDVSLFSKDPALKRVALKNLALRLPGRPFVKFLYLYILRRGFLDGKAGFTYCILQSIYEYLIDLKMWELKRTEKGLPV